MRSRHEIGIAAVGAAVASLTVCLPAQASAEPRDKWTTEVRYDDLDLSTNAGRDELLARVAAAARKNCRSTQRPSSLEMNLMKKCVEVALEHSMPQIEAALAGGASARQLATDTTGASKSGHTGRDR